MVDPWSGYPSALIPRRVRSVNDRMPSGQRHVIYRGLPSLVDRRLSVDESSAASGYLLIAFELSQRRGRSSVRRGLGTRCARAGSLRALEPLAQSIADAKEMSGLATDARSDQSLWNWFWHAMPSASQSGQNLPCGRVRDHNEEQ
jgi:hypothetical protein